MSAAYLTVAQSGNGEPVVVWCLRIVLSWPFLLAQTASPSSGWRRRQALWLFGLLSLLPTRRRKLGSMQQVEHAANAVRRELPALSSVQLLVRPVGWEDMLICAWNFPSHWQNALKTGSNRSASKPSDLIASEIVFVVSFRSCRSISDAQIDRLLKIVHIKGCLVRMTPSCGFSHVRAPARLNDFPSIGTRAFFHVSSRAVAVTCDSKPCVVPGDK
jgi:hypothetical protein